MNYTDVAAFLLDGQIHKFVDIADAVHIETGSDAARIGAIVILFPISMFLCLLGLVLFILSAPFYAAWALVAISWVGAKKIASLVATREIR